MGIDHHHFIDATELEQMYNQSLAHAEQVLSTRKPIVPIKQKKRLLLRILKNLNLPAGLLQSLTGATGHFLKFAQMKGKLSPEWDGMGHSLQFASLGLNIFDFLRIPIIYISAFFLSEKNERLPISTTKNVRWLYATILLALAISSFVFPVAVPYLGVAGSVIALVVSTCTLAHLFYRRNTISNKLKEVGNDINELETFMVSTQKTMSELRKELIEAYRHKNPELTKQKCSTIDHLAEKFNQKYQLLPSVYEQQQTYEHQYQKVNFSSIAAKALGLGLASLALTGMIISLYLAPLGIFLMAISAGIATTYLIARLGFLLADKIRHHVDEPPQPPEVLVEAAKASTLQQDHLSWINEKTPQSQLFSVQHSDGQNKSNNSEFAISSILR